MDTKTLQKSFGMRCKELRAGLGCSQEQFANLIEMDRSYYASIEVGRRNVSLSNLKKIADGFQISIAELMRGVSKFIRLIVHLADHAAMKIEIVPTNYCQSSQ